MRLFISPCPNDTFAFYAMLHNKVDLCGCQFDLFFEDIDKLNTIALERQADVCKVSAAVCGKLNNYSVLDSGAAMGFGNAPLLVAKKGFNKDLSNAKIAIPGLQTTAFAMLKKFFPNVKNIKVALFSDIMELIENDEVDAGVLIHEGRFVYQNRGLELLADFGDLWSKQTNLPIPLGCIVAKNELGQEIVKTVEKVISNSVKFALENPTLPMKFVAEHAQELSPDVQRKHIEYFVNNLTVSMGSTGRQALKNIAF